LVFWKPEPQTGGSVMTNSRRSLLRESEEMCAVRLPEPNLGLFRLLIECPLNRFAYWFVGAMNTANPTARPALTFGQLRNCPLHMIFSSRRLFDGYRPANPFIAS